MVFYTEFIPISYSGSYDLEDPESYISKLTIRGNLGLENSAELSLLAKTLIKGGMRRIMINMEHLSYIDSSGIGLIIQIRKLLKAVNGDFALINVPPKINEAFDLVNLKEYVSIFYSEDKAVEYFKNKRLERQAGKA
jgi:anti-sigma B factor antagonist